ncbi:hypothetical protein PBI_EDMUNDO_56 [Arthrobacter phage Edmundo]|nr:hypothetical protein PBI_EDMUNDO_56 [Arthrobacter phage Edmundo]
MHRHAIHLIKNSLTRYLHDVTRFQEDLSAREDQLSREGGPEAATSLTRKLHERAAQSLAKAQATVAELEGSLRTLQAAEPVHAVHASYGPGQKVAIMGGPHKGDHGTIETIGDDGVLEVRLVAGSVVPVKPSSVRATN